MMLGFDYVALAKERELLFLVIQKKKKMEKTFKPVTIATLSRGDVIKLAESHAESLHVASVYEFFENDNVDRALVGKLLLSCYNSESFVQHVMEPAEVVYLQREFKPIDNLEKTQR